MIKILIGELEDTINKKSTFAKFFTWVNFVLIKDKIITLNRRISKRINKYKK